MSERATKQPTLWSHDVPNQSPQLIIISTLFLMVTTVFFGLRVKERWKRRPHEGALDPTASTKERVLHTFRAIRKLVLSDDAFVCLAYITLLVQTVFGGLAAHYGFGKHRTTIPSTFSTAMLYFYLYQICYKLLGGFTKLTFCALYLKVFVYKNSDVMYQKHFKSLVILTAGVVAAGTFAFTLATIFQCTPVKRAWDRRVPGHCTNNLAFWFSHAAFNTLLDIIVFILPIPVISSIAAARKVRLGLMSTFALGAFVIAASIARMVYLRGSAASTTDPTWGSMPALIWTEVEANTAVIVCCCPALPALVKRLWRKLRLMVGQTVSLDSDGTPKLPSDQNSASLGLPGERLDSTSRSSVVEFFSRLRKHVLSLWTIITGQRRPESPENQPDHEPYYMAGNFSFSRAGNDRSNRKPCFGSKKRDLASSWTNGNEELGVMPPVSYLAPKMKAGVLFRDKKTVAKTEPQPSIMKQVDVMISSNRMSALPSEDELEDIAEFRRQETERKEHADRVFAKSVTGSR